MGVGMGRGRERDSGKRSLPWETRIMCDPGLRSLAPPPSPGGGGGERPETGIIGG